MHVLQPKHSKLKPDEVKKLLDKYNITVSQLPKIRSTDSALGEGYAPGEVVKLERLNAEGKSQVYHRVVVP